MENQKLPAAAFRLFPGGGKPAEHAFQSRENPYAVGMYVDTHVHLYPGVSPVRLMECARASLPDPKAPLTLMLTERAGDHAFEHLMQSEGEKEGLNVTPLDDGLSLRLESPGLAPVYLVAGRQMATAERMEVLALGTRQEFEDGHSLSDTVAAVQKSGALAVVPWALGKWWFGRGRTLRSFVAASKAGAFALADSAMRPMGAPPSPLFSLAREKDIPVLAGTDPLPRPNNETVIGMFGIHLEKSPSEQALTEGIRAAIDQGHFTVYGRRRTLFQVLATMA